MPKFRDFEDQSEDDMADSLARDMMTIQRAKNEDPAVHKLAKEKLKEIAKAATDAQSDS